jgi:hypothetical protein
VKGPKATFGIDSANTRLLPFDSVNQLRNGVSSGVSSSVSGGSGGVSGGVSELERREK